MNYRGHNDRAVWSLLGYTPHCKSFNTSRKVTGVDSVLCGEGSCSELVTVAIPTGGLAEFGDRPSAPIPDSGRIETAAAEAGPSSRRRKKLVASSSTSSSSASSSLASSSSEKQEEMLCHRRPRFAAKDLSAAGFGDVRGEALNAPSVF